jgi:hypothetical protein
MKKNSIIYLNGNHYQRASQASWEPKTELIKEIPNLIQSFDKIANCCFLPTDARLLCTHTLVCAPLLPH